MGGGAREAHPAGLSALLLSPHLPDKGDKPVQDADGYGRLLLDKSQEVGTGDAQRLELIEGADRRRPRRPIEQRELPKLSPGSSTWACPSGVTTCARPATMTW